MSLLITGATGFLGKSLVEKLPLKEYDAKLAKLDDACSHLEHHLIRDILLSIPAGFNPTDVIGDLVWNENFDSVKTKESLDPVLL